MENKKFTQKLNQEDLIAYNSHLVDKKNKSSIMIPLLGLFTTGMGIYSLFQEGNNIVTSIIYIVLGLFSFFFLKKIMANIQKKSIRKHITKNFVKVDMDVTVLDEGIRFEILDDEEENKTTEEVKNETTELSNNELRELEQEEKEVVQAETKEEEKADSEEDGISLELPKNFGGVYDGFANNENYLIDISKKGIYLTVNEKKIVAEVVKITEESIEITYEGVECTLIKKEINDPNSLLKLISKDEKVYVNLAKVAEEGETPKVEEEKAEEPVVNALTIPWVVL